MVNRARGTKIAGDATRSIYSTGYLSGLMNRSVQQIVERLTELGHEPELTINGIPHYGEPALHALQRVIDRERQHN